MAKAQPIESNISFETFKQEVLADFELGWQSRYTSIYARKEVLRGKAKFGIMGAGKELAQIALSKFFNNGDFRAGYYRDQTIAMATGTTTVKQQFSLLYADVDLNHEPQSGGRQMSSHFATRLLDEEGNWKDQLAQPNHTADAAPTASQMGRVMGLGLASKLYRALQLPKEQFGIFTDNGNEVAFATIGDASTSEGIFWEAVNAAGVQQIPIVFNIWDDGYGISVPKKYQTTKGCISTALSGFQFEDGSGLEIFKVNGWDYPALVSTYKQATKLAREQHRSVLVHVEEITQPQGHSTSGSHERYKSEERLQWEKDFDCLVQFHQFIVKNGIATDEELESIKEEAEQYVRQEMKSAWEIRFNMGIEDRDELIAQLSEIEGNDKVAQTIQKLQQLKQPEHSQMDELLKELRIAIRRDDEETKGTVGSIYEFYRSKVEDIYNSHLFADSDQSAYLVKETQPSYADDAEQINGYEVLNHNFKALLAKYPHFIAFGEDLGKIGGVNQSFAGLQDEFGENRVFDTGIREGTIMGQAMGMAMRGLSPLAEIQYLDYMYYGLQQLADEVATLSYRTVGGQKAPVIIRTRGHRLEGIWHSGSPLGMMVNSLRGMHILVPRNMTQAAGFYNTLLQGDDPAIVIEPLNAYRLKEKSPSNYGDFTLPIGQVEQLRAGTDVTLITYGSCVRIAQQAADQLSNLGISVELIDVQSLLPFDLNADILESVKKTNRLVVLDEDVPGGASAFMLQQVLEEQGAYYYLDSQPLTITATDHRPGYGSEHNHFSKPQAIDVVERIYQLMSETNPSAFPTLD